MPTPVAYDYALIRVVPYVERGEFINAGVVLYCRERRYLGASVFLDTHRLEALCGHLDFGDVQQHLDLIVAVCQSVGPMAELNLRERFRWLTGPKSCVVQASEVHSGLCQDPDAELEHLMATLVLPPEEGR